MSDFRCPFYYWTGSSWYCIKINSYLTLRDFDTYCTSELHCAECPYYNR